MAIINNIQLFPQSFFFDSSSIATEQYNYILNSTSIANSRIYNYSRLASWLNRDSRKCIHRGTNIRRLDFFSFTSMKATLILLVFFMGFLFEILRTPLSNFPSPPPLPQFSMFYSSIRTLSWYGIWSKFFWWNHDEYKISVSLTRVLRIYVSYGTRIHTLV